MGENENGLGLFRNALIEASWRKAKQIFEEDPAEVQFSAEHLRKMKQILRYSEHKTWIGHPKLGRKRIVAALIAAIMLLVGSITVYANRDAIIRFMEQAFGKYTRVSYQCDDPDAEIPEWIEEEYTLGYVPEGYELSRYEFNDSVVWFKWKNPADDRILFTQSLIDNAYTQYDNENSESEQIRVSNMMVYYTNHSSATSAYLWTDGLYAYELKCPAELPRAEVIRMIESVTTQTK